MYMYQQPTALRNLCDRHPLLVRHEPKHAEDDEASVEAREAVDERNEEGISEMRRQKTSSNKM